VIAAQLFTGVDAWSSLTGILIIMASFIGITIIGISFVNRSKIKINNRTKNILYSLFALWAIIIGFMIPLSLNNFEEYLLRLPLTTIVFGFAISTAAYFLYSVPRKKENELYQFCIFLGLLIPIFLAIDLRPYVIYDKLTISSAYGTQTYQTPVIIGMIVCLPLLALGGYLLFKAILKKK
jgi:cytochrome bd-type quinol oxidase subunit 2